MPRGSAPRGRQEREGEERDETTTPPSGSRVSQVGQQGDLSPSAGHLPLVMMAAPSGQDSFSMVPAGQRAPSHPKRDNGAGSPPASSRSLSGYLLSGTVPCA